MKSQKTMAKNSLGLIIAVLSAAAFGLYPPASRAVYADGGNPTFMILLTTGARALSLGLYCLLTNKALFQTRLDIKDAITGGFFQAISILGILASLSYLPGPIVIIIIFTHTLMLLFFLAWKREIKLNAITLGATVTALAGLSIVLDIWHPQKLSWIGLALAFIAAIATMSRLYVYGHMTQNRNPAIVGAEVFSLAFFFVLFLPLFITPLVPASPMGFVWAFLSCISLIAGTFGMFYGISLLGSFQFSLFVKLEPVFTALFSAILIHEVLEWHHYFGIALIMISLISYQYWSNKAKPCRIESSR